MIFTTPAMPSPVTAFVLPSVSGLPVSSEPAQLHPITSQLGQASAWQAVPGPLGAPEQLVQLPHTVQIPSGVQLPPVVQIPNGVQFSPMPAPCPPAYGWGQQVVMGTLVPLYPMASCTLHIPARPGPPHRRRRPAQTSVQGPPVLHTLPGSAQKPSEASNKDRATMENSTSTASPHQPSLAPPTGRTTTKPKGEF